MSGRWFAPPELLAELEASGQIVFRYAPGENPNGSVGRHRRRLQRARQRRRLMPHPEHAVDPLTGSADGLGLFASLDRRVAAAA